MGVMACSRKGCEQIMCDRYSDEHGYLCYECFDELIKKGIHTNIDDFMSSNKKRNNPEMGDITRLYFDRIFTQRNGF